MPGGSEPTAGRPGDRLLPGLTVARRVRRGLGRLRGLVRALGRPPCPFPQAADVACLLKEEKGEDRQTNEGDDAQNGPDGLDRVHRCRGILGIGSHRTDARTPVAKRKIRR